MREIKFNAVDEDTGDYIHFDDWVEENTEPHDEGYEQLSRFLDFYYGYTLLQYTGLKDKNGVEIYEGDIVLTNAYKSVPSEVIFQNGRYVAIGKNRVNESIYHAKSIEVIGNIYNNKELLEG